MTKLDRAFDEDNEDENQEKLLEMSQLYQARNISATDLFEILKKVQLSGAQQKLTLQINQLIFRIFFIGCTSLLRHDDGL
jgi:hypothetical protein